jgi:tRNA uridine 5-carbamoylmethylation protein Kti12
MRTLILLTAVPGAGKSTWAASYAANNTHVRIVSSDEVRKEITGTYQDFSQQPLVWETFRRRIHEYARQDRHAIVICDGVNDTNAIRLFYAKDTPEFDKHILVYIVKSLEVIQMQNKKRPIDKWVPVEVVESYFRKIEEPNAEVKAAYDEYIVVT